ncbi:MAG: hypothetical protein HOD43_12860 [Candidatus Marinimicrobia bacterium]|nr:hypothetical protein [Candidatus Neomarinimicrobiota bacterium]MBT4129799.1 hypothetical protein [Candidatus Neomarinimicrobiota bacterium]MBT4296683.1 hypothetical protein [Candidatus Neomarinimicrobiota bacterium]MBT4419206.1 hypothetical protein [Candidatus Neomarinimicrobiota bacterium]MBT4994131.1 hypothetical protein [Candidatus Neomarinimicrobiota bacterium]
MIETDAVKQALSVAGWDLDKELEGLSTAASNFELPRVRIEHKKNGKHHLYIDTGESYLDSASQEIDVAGNMLTGIVFAEQGIRALWEEGAEVPLCSAIDGVPGGKEPLAISCNLCEHSAIGKSCKPKARLFLLAEIDGDVRPLVFALSPTSIKHWNAHKKKLQRSNLPVVAVSTTFKTLDVKKGTYRWAEVKVGIDGIATKEMLILAKQARDQFEEVTRVISSHDYSDPGDQNVEPF